jgi:arylsulfatase A-like enzyme
MADRPNVVVVMTDQQRADASAREGFDLDTTPFLDSLARGGAWFDRAYTSTPVCAPARTGFLTGRFPTATNVWINEQHDAASYDRDLFDVMNDEGYATALVGKNHSYLPDEKLDHYVQFGHWGALNDAAEAARTPADERWEGWIQGTALSEDGGGWSREPAPTPVDTQVAARCVSETRAWIRSLDDGPFFAWLSLPEPHNPYQVPDRYHSLFPPEELPPVEVGAEGLDDKPFEWRWLRRIGVARALREAPDADYEDVLPRLRSNYLGMLRMVDDQVRRFVGFLEEEGLREDTLLVFVSDHGDFAGQYGLMRKGVGLPEATTRIPLFFNGPDVEAGAAPRDAHVSIVDVMPTLCEAVGADVPPGVQGRSLAPVVAGEAGPDHGFDSVYAETGYGGRHSTPEDVPPLEDASMNELNPHTLAGRTAMVRRGEWKLVFDVERGPELYHLEDDPAETTDLSDDPDHADVFDRLSADLLSWSLRVRDPLPEAFPAGDQPPTDDAAGRGSTRDVDPE